MTGRWRGDLTKPDDHLKLSHGLQARWYGEGLAFAVQIAAEAHGGRAGGRREGTARRGRRFRHAAPGRGHELQGTRPRGGLHRGATYPAAVRRAARAPPGRPPLALPARPPGSRLGRTGHAADGRAPRGRARGSGRPRTGRDLLPVRALPAHRQLAAGHPAGEPPGPLERRREPRLGQQVHDQHQHRDELLARRGDEPRRVP